MQGLITLHNGEARVSHYIVAQNTENEEHTITRIIRNYMSDFEEFGMLGFKIHTIKNSKNKINEIKEYLLNEPQATLLLTYMRNSEIVRKFKIALVKAFYELREKITCKSQSIAVDLACPHWRAAFYYGFDGKCFYTGRELSIDNFHLDHIMPRSRGGADELYNLVLSSPAVNSSKGDSVNLVLIERSVNDVKDIYAPKVLEYYHSHKNNIISDELKQCSFMANASFFKMIKDTYGTEAVRKLYTRLIPGLYVKEELSTAYTRDEYIEYFATSLQESEHGFISSSKMYEAYIEFCEQNNTPAVGALILSKKLSALGLQASRKRMLVNNENKQIRGFVGISF